MRPELRPVLLAVLSVVLTAGDSEVISVPLDQSIYDSAFAPGSGTLALITIGSDRVLLVPEAALAASWARISAVAVGRRPVAVVHKRLRERNVFAIVSGDDPAIRLIDAATLKPAGTIHLRGAQPSSAVASDGDDPCLYYFHGRGHESRVACVDLATGIDHGPVAGIDSAMDGAISLDGKLLYTRGPWSPSGLRVHALGPPGAAAREVRSQHESVAGYMPDPAGRAVVVGRTLMDATLERSLARLDVDVLCWSRSRPLLWARSEAGGLCAISANTLRSMGRWAIDMPEVHGMTAPPDGQADFKTFAGTIRLHEDRKRAAVILAGGMQVQLIPLAHLRLPEERDLRLDAPERSSAVVGRELRLALAPRDPAVKLELAAGPAGMALVGDALVWTPTAADIGQAKASIRVSSGGTDRISDLAISVVRPHVQLDVQVELMALHGRTAVCSGSSRPGDQSPPWTRLALIDLASCAATASRRLDAPVAALAIDDHHVYVGRRDSDAVEVLSRTDLAPVRQIFTNGRPGRIISLGGRLVIGTDSGRFMALTVPQLELTTLPGMPPPERTWDSRPPQLMPVQIGDGIWYQGMLFGPDWAGPKAMADPPCLPAYVCELQRLQWNAVHIVHEQAMPAWQCPWGVRISGGGVRHGDRQVGMLPGASVWSSLPAQVAARFPGVISLEVGSEAPAGRVASLVLSDLATGAVVERTLLARDLQQAPNGGLLLEADGMVAIALLDRVFAVPVDPPAARFPAVLHVRQAARTVLLSERDVIVATPGVQTSRGAATWTLSSPRPWLQLKPDGSGIIVSAEGLRAEMASGLQRSRPDAEAFRRLEPQIAGLRAVCRAATGEAPAGLPVWLPIPATVRDADQQRLDVQLGCLVDVPLAWLTPAPPGPAAADRVAELERQLAELRKRLEGLDGQAKPAPGK